MPDIKVNIQYPFNEHYDYVSKLERIDLDKERENDIKLGKGFFVKEPQSIKKELKSPDSIYSARFGQTLQDVNPFMDRYKCECGYTKSRIHLGLTCSVCNTKVKYVDDDFGYFGWICLKDPYYIIHPNMYKSIEYLVGSATLDAIIDPSDQKDENGFQVKKKKKIIKRVSGKRAPKIDETFKETGMVGFKEKFDEIMKYFVAKNPGKKDYYDDIMKNKNIIFIQSIPVYTTMLRPFKVEGDRFSFEGTNAIYNIMARLAAQVNKDKLRMQRKLKSKNSLLYDIQIKYNELYGELENILAQKKGQIRSLIGGRYNFTARSVIIPDPSLRIDQITLPYHALVELLQQTIINILSKSYNISHSDAYKIWYKSQIVKNNIVYEIIENLIKAANPIGLPFLINRNLSRVA